MSEKYVVVWEEHLRDGYENGAKVFRSKEEALAFINYDCHDHNIEYQLFKLGESIPLLRQTVTEPQPAKVTTRYVV